MKDGAYVANLNEYKSIGTQLIASYANCISVKYFNGIGVQHIVEEIKKYFSNKSIITSIFRLQSHDLIMCGHFSIKFIDFISKRKCLTDFTNLFGKIDKVILYYSFRRKCKHVCDTKQI